MIIPAKAITAAASLLQDLIEAGYRDGEVMAKAALEAAAPLIAAAERERIILALLGCRDCGQVHQPHEAVMEKPSGRPGMPYTSWAAADGHIYKPRFRAVGAGTAMRAELEALIGGAP